MNALRALAELREFGQPAIETQEASALLGISSSNASHLLASMSKAGLIRRIRHGLWAVDPQVDPFVVGPYLTAPHPAYVSLWSALASHGMIEQIPGKVFVVSLGESRQVETRLGSFSIHHVAPEVFGGFSGEPATGYVASPEKALFDVVYVRAPRGGRAHFTELSLPADFRRSELDRWTSRIRSAKLRTIVGRGVEIALDQAEGG